MRLRNHVANAIAVAHTHTRFQTRALPELCYRSTLKLNIAFPFEYKHADSSLHTHIRKSVTGYIANISALNAL